MSKKTPEVKVSPPWIKWLVLLGVLFLTVLSFRLSLQNGFTNWDDDVYVTNNPYLNNWTGKLGEIFTQPIADNYHPLTIVSLAIDRGTGALSASSFHRTNLFLHLLVCVLVFLLTCRLARGNLWVSGITTAMFAIHPMHVESVAWISERKDLLYSLFFIAGMLAHLRYIKGENKAWYGAALLLFLLSCLSKPAAVVFPLVLLLLDYYEGRTWKTSLILEKLPHFALAIVFGVITIMIQKSTAIGDLQDFSIIERLGLGGYAFMSYLLKLFVPTGLSALHPYPDFSNGMPVQYYLAPLGMLGVLTVAFFLGKKNRIWWFGVAFFFVNVLLVLQFISVGNAIIAERYTYLSYWGLFFLLSSLVFTSEKTRSISPYLLAAPFVLLIGWYAMQTMQACTVWKNGGTLWTNMIETYPKERLAYTKRGHYYNGRGNMPAALKDFKKAAKLAPSYYGSYAGLGEVYLKSQKFGDAVEQLNKAIELNPKFNKTVHNRGVAYLNWGSQKSQEEQNERAEAYFAKAAEDFQQAEVLDPSFLPTYFSHSKLLQARGDFDGAIAKASEAIKKKPQSLEAYENRANIYYQRGNEIYAAKDPASARSLYELAKKDVNKVINAGAPFPVSYNLRALINHLNGNYDAALQDYNKAIELRPDFPDAIGNRDVLLKSMSAE